MSLRTLFFVFGLAVLASRCRDMDCSAAAATESSDKQPCCHKATSQPCRRACEKVVRGRRGFRRLKAAIRHCQASQVAVWQCMNATVESHRAYRQRIGSLLALEAGCCRLDSSIPCQVACANAEGYRDVEAACKTEPEVLRCITPSPLHHAITSAPRINTTCCQATDADDRCRRSCILALGSRKYIDTTTMVHLKSACLSTPAVFICVADQIGQNKNLLVANECCSRGKNQACRDTCVETLKEDGDLRSKMDRLIRHCGIPLPQDSMWGCLLNTSGPKGKNTRAIGKETSITKAPNMFKKHCCARAKSIMCKEWCTKIFSNPSYVDQQDSTYAACMENPIEQNLSSCVGDVLEPCQFGCEANLKFCSAFSSRPFDMFRRCDAKADAVAQSLYDVWSTGTISYRSMTVHVKDIRQCQPQKWKALACSIALKPCDRKSNNNQVCRSDCIEILNACLDRRKNSASLTPAKVCAVVLPNGDHSSCVRIGRFLNVPVRTQTIQINLPCRRNPCKRGEMCVVNEECVDASAQSNCMPHRCIPGCALDATSKFVIAEKSYGKLLVPSSHSECYQICRCMRHDTAYRKSLAFVDCHDLPCAKRRPCLLGNRTFEHGSVFNHMCNFCTCVDGETICTRHSCDYLFPEENKKHENAPGVCDCSRDFHPVCGSNGITYSNLCYAKCLLPAEHVIHPLPCDAINPCANLPCSENQRCVVDRQMCLDAKHVCPQYKCVSTELQFVKSCAMQRDGSQRCVVKEVAPGECTGSECQSSCQNATLIDVCGFDGITYASECHAEMSFTDVHHAGKCMSTTRHSENFCKSVQCLKSRCNGPIPPGSCCPICGSLLHILFSSIEVERYHSIVPQEPITVQAIVRELRRQIAMGECRLSGYVMQFGALAVIVRPRSKTPSAIQTSICRGEAEKLFGLINTGSPIFMTNYPLSVLKWSRFQSPGYSVQSAASRVHSHNSKAIVFFLTLVTWLAR